jgi:hypothetical protein
MDDARERQTPRFSDPLFNGGQQMRMHDGEERRYQVDAGDGHDVTAGPPAGTVGADRAPGIGGGGPQAHRQTHDEGDVLAERFGAAADTFDGSAAGWTEEPPAGGGMGETPQGHGGAAQS